MARALKLAGACLVGLAAASALDDSAALIQQSREPTPPAAVALLREEAADVAEADGYTAKICSPKALKDFNERMAKYHKLVDADMEELRKKTTVKIGEAVMEAQNRTVKLLEPMLQALDAAAKYVKAETEPHNVRIIKASLQKLFAGPLVPSSKVVDFNASVKALNRRWEEELWPHSLLLLKSGFEKLHVNIESAKSQYSPALRKHMDADSGYPPEHIGDLVNFLVPTISMEYNPILKEIAELMIKMPKEQKETQKWITKELLPYMMKKLPPKCQAGKLATDLGFGFGDISNRAGKFLQTCLEEMGMASRRHHPQRACVTCQEQYNDLTIRFTSNSCAGHCMPQTLSCLSSGLNDKCIQSFHDCVKCHAHKLEMLDKCEKTDARKGMVKFLQQVQKVVKHASVEKTGVSKFMDDLLDLANV
mmetsp:Transcript_985/g.2805  ORF Transcript_985/g.2805 Transcript_985/m.2805 type:complete len:421 (-) Transcript_985:100-1362(-)